MEIELKPYPEYKETMLPWLPSLPSHWETGRAKRIFRLSIEKSASDHGLELLSVYTHIGVKPRKSLEQRGNKATTTDGYWIVKKGDIISNKLLAWMGAIGVSHYDGVTSPAYDILRPRVVCNPDYYHYLFRTPTYLQQFKSRSRGIMDMRLRLYFDELGQIPIPILPIEDQNAIVKFLDVTASKVNKFIRNKRRLIDLLKEQKQNIVNHAVTKGINPDVKLKPSGVDWLGDIPEHWSTAKIKKVALFGPSKSETNDNPDCEKSVVFLPMEKISVDGKIECSEKHLLKDIWNGFTYFRRGDVVIAKITPCFENGKGAYLSELESEYGFGTTELIVIRPLNRISGSFLRCHTSTNHFLLLGQQSMTGAAGQQRVSVDFIKNYVISLPPINEQDKIVEFIAHKTTEIDKAISRAEREIELIREYRARLISDAVTGKVDVRNIAVADVNTVEDISDIDDEPEFESVHSVETPWHDVSTDNEFVEDNE